MLKEILLRNIECIHTTPMGITRICMNLGLVNKDPVEYCKNIIRDSKSTVTHQGKNYYCTLGRIKITINASSFTIITVHTI